MQIPKLAGEVPYLTTEQMVEVDRLMIETYHIELVQMMENAGRNLAYLARERFLAGDPRGKRVVVLAGTGGNGGGALVAGRRLHNYGAWVTVYVTREMEAYQGVPAHQLDILQRMGVVIAEAKALPGRDAQGVDLILDGVIGYSLKGAPCGAAAELIAWANRQAAPVLSLDVPSGVDATTGTVHVPAVRAAATLTLALPKVGLRMPGVADVIGELYMGDISVPPAVYAALGLEVGHVFALGDVVRIA